MAKPIPPFMNQDLVKVVHKLLNSPDYIHRSGQRPLFRPSHMPEGSYLRIEQVAYFIPKFGQAKEFVATINKLNYLGEDGRIHPMMSQDWSDLI